MKTANQFTTLFLVLGGLFVSVSKTSMESDTTADRKCDFPGAETVYPFCDDDSNTYDRCDSHGGGCVDLECGAGDRMTCVVESTKTIGDDTFLDVSIKQLSTLSVLISMQTYISTQNYISVKGLIFELVVSYTDMSRKSGTTTPPNTFIPLLSQPHISREMFDLESKKFETECTFDLSRAVASKYDSRAGSGSSLASSVSAFIVALDSGKENPETACDYLCTNTVASSYFICKMIVMDLEELLGFHETCFCEKQRQEQQQTIPNIL
jgi:hypothetical protein